MSYYQIVDGAVWLKYMQLDDSLGSSPSFKQMEACIQRIRFNVDQGLWKDVKFEIGDDYGSRTISVVGCRLATAEEALRVHKDEAAAKAAEEASDREEFERLRRKFERKLP